LITIIEMMLILLAGRLHVCNWLKNLNVQNIYKRNKKADSFELGFSYNISPAHATMQDWCWVGAVKVHHPVLDDQTFERVIWYYYVWREVI